MAFSVFETLQVCNYNLNYTLTKARVQHSLDRIQGLDKKNSNIIDIAGDGEKNARQVSQHIVGSGTKNTLRYDLIENFAAQNDPVMKIIRGKKTQTNFRHHPNV